MFLATIVANYLNKDWFKNFFHPRDQMEAKYPGISPYAYCLNNPLRYIDPDGRAPGDIFKTKREAAKDWGNFYNGKSILNDKEYGSSIYKIKDGYTYTEAKVGTYKSVTSSKPENGEKVEALIHSHAEYMRPSDNDFSPNDKDVSERMKVIDYVATPNGSLLEYNPKTKKTETISEKGSLPFDPRDPSVPKEMREQKTKALHNYLMGIKDTPKRDPKQNTNKLD